MATSLIVNTIKDLNGTGISGVKVIARLMPGPGFRIGGSDANTEVASEDRATTDASGLWALFLERNSNIDPAGTYYVIEEQIPAASGGPRTWTILVGAADSTLHGALISPPPALVTPDYLTIPVGDARYGSLIDSQKNNTGRRLYLRQFWR